jgi:hypothetical protein
MFFSWNSSKRPPYSSFSKLKKLSFYSSDSPLLEVNYNLKKRMRLLKRICASPKLESLNINTMTLDAASCLQRYRKLKFLHLGCSFPEFVSAKELEIPGVEYSINFHNGDSRTIINFDVKKKHNLILNNTRSIDLAYRPEQVPTPVLPLICLYANQFQKLTSLTCEFFLDRFTQFPDLNALRKLKALDSICFKLEVGRDTSPTLFDKLVLPERIREFRLNFLKSGNLDLKNALNSQAFFIGLEKLKSLELFELTMCDSIYGITYESNDKKKKYYSYFIKRCLARLTTSLKHLSVEAPISKEPDENLFKLVYTFKNLESLDLNLNTSVSKEIMSHRTKQYQKIKKLRLYDSLSFLMGLTNSSFEQIENLSLLVLEPNGDITIIDLLDKILLMKNLEALEIFFFPRKADKKLVAERIVELFRTLNRLQELKFITSFFSVEMNDLINIYNHLKWNSRLTTAIISFKDVSIRRRVNSVAYIKYEDIE